jgi:hypothetical protein
MEVSLNQLQFVSSAIKQKTTSLPAGRVGYKLEDAHMLPFVNMDIVEFRKKNRKRSQANEK